VSRKGWLTPNSGATEYLCRPVLVPRDDNLYFLAAVNGALLDLTHPWNWEQYGDMTPEEAAAVMLQMYVEYTAIPCEEVIPCAPCTIDGDEELGYEGPIRIIRRGAGGYTEELVDGTWTPPTGEYEVPTLEVRTEPTADERRCLASANAANVLADLYEEVTDQVAIDSAPAAVFGVVFDFVILVVGAFAGPTAAAYASLGKTAFDAFIETAETLASDVWDSEFTDELTCFMYEFSTDSAGIVTFDWPPMRESITDKFVEAVEQADVDRALLWGQVGYLFDILAAGGIDVAGTTTTITTYDCDSCGFCNEPFEGVGNYNFELNTGQQGWIFNTTLSRGTFTGTNWSTGPNSPAQPAAAIQKDGIAGQLASIRVYVRACQTTGISVAGFLDGVGVYSATGSQAANGCAVSGGTLFTLPADVCVDKVHVTINTATVGNGAISRIVLA